MSEPEQWQTPKQLQDGIELYLQVNGPKPLKEIQREAALHGVSSYDAGACVQEMILAALLWRERIPSPTPITVYAATNELNLAQFVRAVAKERQQRQKNERK